ncbi:uncharacterized protein LOC105226784 [Bactrocera dorsalis]|uniref:Uncharacterized protein LOC105226784 n=1 Tax=Bactrocera dorsalis TaxID=27457 RepID=A0A6I9V5X2_BACDO|nr:uncharacterized protein LOC105226784 [Bactrocera dorsalis]
MIRKSLTESDARPNDKSMELSASEINTSRLQCSQSSVSSESDLSFSLSIERDLDALLIDDELPAFEIRLISPLGRTPSPIDSNAEDLQTPTRLPQVDDDSTPNACQNTDFVALHEINALISPPADNEERRESLSRYNSLETIFEGVFLNTPPKNASNIRRTNSMRSNIIEKNFISRMHTDKENQIPNGIDSNSPSRNNYQPK